MKASLSGLYSPSFKALGGVVENMAPLVGSTALLVATV